MKLRLLMSLGFLLVCTASLLCQQNDAWKEYVYSDDGFAISAPVEPRLEQVGNSNIYVSTGSNDERLGVSVTNMNGKSDQELRDMIKQTYAEDSSVTPSSIDEIYYANTLALRAQKQVGSKHHSVRALCVDGRMFIIEASEGPVGERFINSFRLVESQWKEYSYPEDGFRLSSPAAPQVDKDASRSQYIIDLPHGGGFMIMSRAFRPAPNISAARAAMLGIRDSVIGKLQGKLTANSVLSAEFPGIGFEFDIPSKAAHIRGRMYYAGARIYTILTKGDLATTDAIRFFDSFHVMNPRP